MVLDYFSYKIGPIDLVKVLFSSLHIGTYIQPTCGPLCTFWGITVPPNGPKKAQRPAGGPDVWPKVKASKWAPNQINSSIHVEEIVQNNEGILGHLGTPNEPKKVQKRLASGWDVGPNV
jgi:hypothetical protein